MSCLDQSREYTSFEEEALLVMMDKIIRLSIIPEGQLFERLGQCSSTKYKNSFFLSQDEIAEKCIIEKLQSIFCQNVLHVTKYAWIS